MEDQKKTAGFVRKALQAQGFAADVCANGDDALVLGIMIPGRDGLSVLRQLRDRLAGQLDEIQRLAKIVDGLTLLTKADAGLVELKREPVALDEVLREVVADAQILARPSELSVTLAGCVPARLLGDKHRLRQVLLNLADNAVKYNRPGGNIEFAPEQTDGQAVIRVANTGPGVAAEDLPRVFERFHRGNTALRPEVEGCGLGLSVAQWIVQAHQGTIRLQSPPGGPTTVTVQLPLA